MAKGESGRIVLEVNPDLKKQLYSVLALEQKTLKDWFIEHAEKHIDAKKSYILNSLKDSKSEI